MIRQVLATLAALLLIGLYMYPIAQIMISDPANPAFDLQTMVPEADMERVRADYITFVSGDLSELQARMDSSLRTPETLTQLTTMREMLPEGVPAPARLINMNWRLVESTNGSRRMTELVVAYDYPDKTVLFTAAYTEQAAGVTINRMFLQPDAGSLLQTHRVGFDQLSPPHILFITLYLIIMTITVWALYSCLMTTGLKWKWAWAIFILIGIGSVSFQWSGGALTHIQPLFIRLPSAAISQMFFQSAVVHFGLPLGAVLFLLRRFKSRKAAPVTLTQDEPAT